MADLGIYRSETFSFNLFGIFLSISNKIPPLLKACGTLVVMLQKKSKYKKQQNLILIEMKLIAKILFTCLFSFLIVSCDPPHYIDFVNNSNSNAKVKFSINPKTENHNLRSIATGDSIVFNLKPKDTANIHFGIGNWSDKEIDEVLNSIKNIEIETEDVKTIYKTENSMKRILETNREGFLLRSKIEIEIK